MPEPSNLAADLRADPPRLHASGSAYWGLAWPALEWLVANVKPGMATLETGAGSSTIVFASAGADHEAVSPFADEHERIKEECARRGIDASRLRFHVGSSHEVLPRWEPRPLDLVLVDGAHGFPYPIVDFWHLAPHVKIGGLMLLDDAYMAPVGMLVDHLRTRPSWEVVGPVGYRTVIVKKLADDLPDFDWSGERLGGRMRFDYLPLQERVVASLRHRALSMPAGLAAVAVARRRLGFLFR